MTTPTTTFFTRHPRLTVLGVLLAATFVVMLLLEVGLRVFGSLDIHYYAGTRTPGLHRYPYGDVPINAEGFPDEEFGLGGTKTRIGYVGDSVTYGVGAGYGFRVPDLLQQQFPQYDHWVFANVGERLDQRILLAQIEKFKLNAVFYLMNLNDIVPDAGSAEATTWVTEAKGGWIGGLDGMLRGSSYLYTYLRLGLKNGMQRLGYEAHGLPAFELLPSQHRAVIEGTARRVASALQAAAGKGVRSCVLVLPYEMQVSTDAARVYRDMGFSWEPGFETGSTQQILLAVFEQLGVTALDARDAFAGTQLKVGEAFVYDKGDKVDWNHPNRRGHALMAAWLAARPDLAARCFEPVPRSESR
jgi:hypothetical protein